MITPEQLAALLSRARHDALTTLTGSITRQSGGRCTVLLDQPYRGSNTLDAQVGSGCNGPGRVSVFLIQNRGWVAFGTGQQRQGRTVVQERRGRPSGRRRQFELKAGYCYRRTVSGSTGLVCPAAPPGGNNTGNNFPVSPNLTSPYHPIPAGETRLLTFTQTRFIGYTKVGTYVSDTDNLTFTDNSSLTPVSNTYGPYLVDSTLTVTSGFQGVEIGGSITGETGGGVASVPIVSGSSSFLGIGGGNPSTPINNAIATTSYLAYAERVEPGLTRTLTESYTGLLTFSFDAPVLLPSPDNGGVPLPDAPPENPNDPATPDLSESYEFRYSNSDSTESVLLKKLAKNQPFEITPYILHVDPDTTYCVIKYGKALNDGGDSDDWCKLSLFEVVGTDTLTSTETIYAWGQQDELVGEINSAVETPFAAVVGNKTKLTELDIPALITAGDLEAQFRCQLHRNLIGMRVPDVGEDDVDPFVYLLDPVDTADSELSDLAGDAYYSLTEIHDTLRTATSITVTPRKFLLEQNPDFTGSGEDCATNPAYRLQEDEDGALDAVEVKGLGSEDNSIVVLTMAAGWVES